MEVNLEAIKNLREKTGAGYMECKKALQEANHFEEAITILRKRGLAKAQKKSGRATREGLIGAYVHFNGKIAALVEVMCETDFVARTEEFKNFVGDLARQVIISQPQYVKIEDIPEDVLEKEKEVYREQAMGEGKPEKVIERIVEGKLKNWFQEVVLLEQPYFNDQEKTVKEVLTEMIASLGENIQIVRFVRFQLGETSA